jgi:hypothetical protein
MKNGLDIDDRSHTQGENGFHTRSFLILFGNEDLKGGAPWRSWLRHYATNRQVAGSIPDDVIGIFQ